MTTVKNTAELQAAIAAGTDPLTIQVAEAVPATVESFDLEPIKAEAAAAERVRILGINALAATGFEAEVSAAIEGGSTVEAAALTMFKAAQDRGISLAGIKADATATNSANPPAKTEPQISVSSIWAARKGAKQ